MTNVMIQFEDVDGGNLSEVLHVPININLDQLRSLIDKKDISLYINGILIKTTLKDSLQKEDIENTENIKKIKLVGEKKGTAPAVFCSAAYSGHQGPVLRVKLCKNENKELLLITGGGDKTLRIWDMMTKTQVLVNKSHNHWVNNIETNKKHIFSGCMEGTLNIFDFKGNLIKTIKNQKNGINNLKIYKEKYLISSSRDNSLFIYEISSDAEVKIKMKTKYKTLITSLEIKEDVLALGFSDGNIIIYKMKGEEFEYFQDIKKTRSKINSMAISHGHLICGDDNGEILVFKDFVLKNIIKGHKREVISVSIEKEGMNFATGSFDKTVKIWNIEKMRLIKSYYHLNFVYKVKYYKDLVISISKDKMIKLYKEGEGKVVSEFVLGDEVYDFDLLEGHLVGGCKDSKVYFYK